MSENKIEKIYSKGCVYSLKSDQTNDIYIGSTTQKYLSTRFALHKNSFKRYLNGKYVFMSSFFLLKYEDCKIVKLNEYTNITKKQLLKYEGEEVNKNENCINQRQPGRSRS